MLVDHLPVAVAPGPDPGAAHPAGLHLALGVGPAAVVEHAAVGQIANHHHMQLVGLEKALALAELEAALPVGAVLVHTLELQRSDSVEGDQVFGVLGHDRVQSLGLDVAFERLVELANAAFVLADILCHVHFLLVVQRWVHGLVEWQACESTGEPIFLKRASIAFMLRVGAPAPRRSASPDAERPPPGSHTIPNASLFRQSEYCCELLSLSYTIRL